METPVTAGKKFKATSWVRKVMTIDSWDQKHRFLHRGDTVTAGPYYEDSSRPLVLQEWVSAPRNHHFPL